MKSGKVVLGLVAGFATGTLLGLLFAPDKGTDTRKKISKKQHKYSNAAEKKFNTFIDEITEKFDALMNEIGFGKSETTVKANEGKKEADHSA
ncbi:MAG: YtxH domain-containing protein [Bacteroidetes bacterium]|nr:YtxH domain-containing protein [Bacteroidota bacterium]